MTMPHLPRAVAAERGIGYNLQSSPFDLSTASLTPLTATVLLATVTAKCCIGMFLQSFSYSHTFHHIDLVVKLKSGRLH